MPWLTYAAMSIGTRRRTEPEGHVGNVWGVYTELGLRLTGDAGAGPRPDAGGGAGRGARSSRRGGTGRGQSGEGEGRGARAPRGVR
eukprot:4155504-Prymnesium_polylepis.1